MVCIRCKMVVKDELKRLGLQYTTVELGEVEVLDNISTEQHDKFKAALLRSGLELMDDKKSVLIQQIKNVIVELVLVLVSGLQPGICLYWPIKKSRIILLLKQVSPCWLLLYLILRLRSFICQGYWLLSVPG